MVALKTAVSCPSRNIGNIVYTNADTLNSFYIHGMHFQYNQMTTTFKNNFIICIQVIWKSSVSNWTFFSYFEQNSRYKRNTPWLYNLYTVPIKIQFNLQQLILDHKNSFEQLRDMSIFGTSYHKKSNVSR